MSNSLKKFRKSDKQKKQPESATTLRVTPLKHVYDAVSNAVHEDVLRRFPKSQLIPIAEVIDVLVGVYDETLARLFQPYSPQSVINEIRRMAFGDHRRTQTACIVPCAATYRSLSPDEQNLHFVTSMMAAYENSRLAKKYCSETGREFRLQYDSGEPNTAVLKAQLLTSRLRCLAPIIVAARFLPSQLCEPKDIFDVDSFLKKTNEHFTNVANAYRTFEKRLVAYHCQQYGVSRTGTVLTETHTSLEVTSADALLVPNLAHRRQRYQPIQDLATADVLPAESFRLLDFSFGTFYLSHLEFAYAFFKRKGLSLCSVVLLAKGLMELLIQERTAAADRRHGCSSSKLQFFQDAGLLGPYARTEFLERLTGCLPAVVASLKHEATEKYAQILEKSEFFGRFPKRIAVSEFIDRSADISEIEKVIAYYTASEQTRVDITAHAQSSDVLFVTTKRSKQAPNQYYIDLFALHHVLQTLLDANPRDSEMSVEFAKTSTLADVNTYFQQYSVVPKHVKGDLLEKIVRNTTTNAASSTSSDAFPQVLENRVFAQKVDGEVRVFGEIDAAFLVDEILVVVECKSMHVLQKLVRDGDAVLPQSSATLDKDAIDQRLAFFETALEKQDRLIQRLLKNPVGATYDLTKLNFKMIVPVLVTPFVEFIPRKKHFWLTPTTPRILEVNEFRKLLRELQADPGLLKDSFKTWEKAEPKKRKRSERVAAG